MVGAEDRGAAVVRVFVEPVDRGGRDRAAPVPDQNVVEDEPGQGMAFADMGELPSLIASLGRPAQAS